MVKIVRLLALCATLASLAACGSVDSPSQLTSEDFTGTLSPSAQVSHPFSVSKTGEMQLTLQSLTPRPVVGFVSLSIGSPVGSDCSPFTGYFVAQAATGQQYAFPQISKGSYCVLIADSNFALTAPVAYSVRLLHP